MQLANRCSFDEYVAADDGVQCSPMPTIQDIVSSVTQISEEGETDDVGDPLPAVTYKQAYSAFQDLRSYLLCSQGKDSENLYAMWRVSFSKLAVILLCKARLQII